jgi:CheY-like chemotaxis protein
MDNIGRVDILLVEDNPQDADLTMRALTKRHVVNPLYLVQDGAEALEFLFAEGKYAHRQGAKLPRVVLLDLKLPKVGGLEVLQAVKADERTKRIPVVVLTSSKEDPDIKRAYALGVNSYVVKPVGFDAFSDAISNLGFYWLLVNEPPAL